MPEPNFWNTATCHKVCLQRENYTTDNHIILVDGCCLSVETLVNRGREIKNYIYEPSEEIVLNELIPKSLKIQLLKAIKDSFASEHGARMTAMHKATDNATELRDELKLSYNKARQAAITNEILEIVGGAEALKG